MDKISDVEITTCENSIYAKPLRMKFKQNGREKDWELMKVHDSVIIVIYNITRKKMIFVKQFRAAVYINRVEFDGDTIDTSKYPGRIGITLEHCAGIVDKDLPLADIAKEEILEECGYDIPVNNLERITSYCASVGLTGSLQTMFYAEVTDEMRVGSGGGCIEEGEFIEVVEIPIPEVRKMMYDESFARPMSFLFGTLWFFNEKYPILQMQHKL